MREQCREPGRAAEHLHEGAKTGAPAERPTPLAKSEEFAAWKAAHQSRRGRARAGLWARLEGAQPCGPHQRAKGGRGIQQHHARAGTAPNAKTPPALKLRGLWLRGGDCCEQAEGGLPFAEALGGSR